MLEDNGYCKSCDDLSKRIADLERELAECKEDAKDWKNRYEGMAILHANKVRMIENGDLVRRVNISKIEAERDALAAQVVQMRELLPKELPGGFIGLGKHYSENVSKFLPPNDPMSKFKYKWFLECQAIDTKPAQEAINAVKAQAAKEERDACATLCDGMILYTGFDCAEKIRECSDPMADELDALNKE